MSKTLITCLILLTTLLTACTSPQPDPVPSVTYDLTTKEIEASATPKPTEKAVPSRTPLPSSPTPRITHTLTPVGEIPPQQCIQSHSSLPGEVVPPGILATNGIGQGISLLNFKAQTREEIKGVILSAGTAPDGNWLAYSISRDKQILVVFESMLGEQTIQVVTDNSWTTELGIRWMDNQRIWFPDIHTIQPATSILVLNPFTGQKELIKTDYPGTMHYNYGPDLLGYHFGYSSAIYDPSLNYVIYPEFEEGKGYFQTLWDRKSQRAIARVSDDGYYQNLPIWQESEKQFLIAGFLDPEIRQKEWFSVNLDGQIHQITNFGGINKNYLFDNNAVLSPDGKTLALSLSLLKADRSAIVSTRLILLNLETGISTDTCLPVDEITWSLDGRYLAVSTPLENGIDARILVIDRKTNQSYQIMKGRLLRPVGWLVQP
jgi:hypothetical protein